MRNTHYNIFISILFVINQIFELFTIGLDDLVEIEGGNDF